MKWIIPCILAMVLFSLNTVADVLQVLVDESFTNSSAFSSSQSTAGWYSGDASASNTFSPNHAVLSNTGTANALRAQINRNTDQAGNALYNGAKVYNFYDHALQMSIDINSVSGIADTSTRVTYYLGVFEYANRNNIVPLGAKAAAIALEALNDGYRIVVCDGSSITYVGSISEVPTTMTAIMDGNDWSFDMEGAVFTAGGFAGGSSAAGTFTEISESTFAGEFYFGTGLRHTGAVLSAGSMDLSNVTVSVIPEPATVSLFATFSGCLFFMRKWVRR